MITIPFFVLKKHGVKRTIPYAVLLFGVAQLRYVHLLLISCTKKIAIATFPGMRSLKTLFKKIRKTMIAKLLNQTIDSLDLRLFSHSCISPALHSQLEQWRNYKENFDYSKSEPYFVDFLGLGRFHLLPRGHSPYEFTFVNEEIGQIYLMNPDKFSTKFAINTGQLYLNFRSKYLQCQTDDYGLVDQFVASCFSVFFHQTCSTWVKVSRADLACDVSGVTFNWEDLTKLCSRSRKRDGLSSFCTLADLKEVQDVLSKLKPQNDNKGVSNDSSPKSQTEALTLTPKQINILFELTTQAIEDPSMSRAIFGHDLQTAYIGRFGSKIYSRIYLKSEEIKVNGKEWLTKIWENFGWEQGDQVWRTEFSLSGDFLKEFLISDLNQDDFISLATHAFYEGETKSFKEITTEAFATCGTNLHHWQDFRANLHRIWTYCTGSWLRHTTGENSTNARSPNSDFWDCVSTAFDKDLNFCRLPLPAPPSEGLAAQLLSQAKGCIKTFTALIIGGYQIAFGDGSKDWKQKEFFHGLLNVIGQELKEEITFDDIDSRRDLYGCDDFSDTQFSTALRVHRMKLGRGS